MELGYYVVETVDEAEYLRRLDKNITAGAAFGKTSEELLEVNGFKLNGTYLIHRHEINISGKDFIINLMQDPNKKGSIGNSLIKKSYPVQEAREKFPEFFL